MTQTNTLDGATTIVFKEFTISPDEERLILRLRQLRNNGCFGAVLILEGMELVPATRPERLAPKQKTV